MAPLSYCPLIWMFHSGTLNNKINRLHKQALRIVYSAFKANFDELLEIDGSFSIHHRNIQTLAIEMFKFLNGLSPPIMNEVFQVMPSAPYSPRDNNELYSSIIRILYNHSLDSFKKSIRKWKPICLCRLCKTYLQHVGFI